MARVNRRNSDTMKYKLGWLLMGIGIALFIFLDLIDRQGMLSLKIGNTNISAPTLFIMAGLLNVLPVERWVNAWRKR